MILLKNLTIFSEDNIVTNGYIKFDDKIREIGSNTNEKGIDMKGLIAIPGFIDTHIHGVNGYDNMDDDPNAVLEIAKILPHEGTTSFLATTMTETKENILTSLKHIRNAMLNKNKPGAEILGIHLEGPFINILAKGGQRGNAIVEPSIALFDEFNEASGYQIKHVTIAPEIRGALPLIEHMEKKSIVSSVGHTKATSQEVLDALSVGCHCFTHAYNAMSGLHHRDIGSVGEMLLNDNTYAELICDKVHVSPQAVKLLYKAKTADKILLITDSMRAKLLSDGESELGGQKVYVNKGVVRLADGTLAGSILRLIDGAKNMQEINQLGLKEIIKMTSVNPAKIHNFYDRKGSLKVGKDADILIVDNQLNLYETYCLGNLSYQKD